MTNDNLPKGLTILVYYPALLLASKSAIFSNTRFSTRSVTARVQPWHRSIAAATASHLPLLSLTQLPVH